MRGEHLFRTRTVPAAAPSSAHALARSLLCVCLSRRSVGPCRACSPPAFVSCVAPEQARAAGSDARSAGRALPGQGHAHRVRPDQQPDRSVRPPHFAHARKRHGHVQACVRTLSARCASRHRCPPRGRALSASAMAVCLCVQEREGSQAKGAARACAPRAAHLAARNPVARAPDAGGTRRNVYGHPRQVPAAPAATDEQKHEPALRKSRGEACLVLDVRLPLHRGDWWANHVSCAPACNSR